MVLRITSPNTPFMKQSRNLTLVIDIFAVLTGSVTRQFHVQVSHVPANYNRHLTHGQATLWTHSG